MVNDSVMMQKCLNGLSPSYLSNKFCTRSSIHDRQTRHRGNLNILFCSSAHCGVKIWNSLNENLKQIAELICDVN